MGRGEPPCERWYIFSSESVNATEPVLCGVNDGMSKISLDIFISIFW